MLRARPAAKESLRTCDYCDAHHHIHRVFWSRRPDTTQLRSRIYAQLGLHEVRQEAIRFDRIPWRTHH